MGLTFGPSTSHPSFANYVPCVALGASFGGGFLICKAGGVAWIVSPYSAEVSRTWYAQSEANTRAQQVSGCTGWFVPTISQLQNPGYLCRSFWGPAPCFSSSQYWSCEQYPPNNPYGCNVNFANGSVLCCHKANSYCIRAFRCVTY